MKAVIDKLAEIEATAQASVEHAETRKYEIEKEIMKKRKEFDETLENETLQQLQKLRHEREEKMRLKMEEESIKNSSYIEQLKDEFDKNHTIYAKEILKNILEV